MQTDNRQLDAKPQAAARNAGPRVEAAGLTDVGRERETNEDAYLIATLQRTMIVQEASPQAQGWFQGAAAGTLLMVADGMGGQGGGAMASRTAVSSVADFLLNMMSWGKLPSVDSTPRTSQTGLRAQLSSALVVTDRAVKSVGAQTNTPHMGTTLTVALVLWPALYVAHVGDTRCYLLQAGVLRRLTTDHNMAQRVVDESPSPIDPPEHLQNILWNALGGSDDAPQPEVTKVPLEGAATLLLCSDGLNKHVSDEQILAVLLNHESCAVRCARLVALANAAGGTDNITALVAELHPPGSG